MDFMQKYLNSADIKSYIYTLYSSMTSFISEGSSLILLFILGKSLILLIVGWWIINKISKMTLVFFNKTCIDGGITSFLDSLLKFSLRIILIVIVMQSFGFDVTSILAAIGASFLAVGLSLKESLSNFISGIVLIINKPIHVGDFIEFESFSGKVLKIEMLFTTLQTEEEGKTIVIPNTKLVSNVVVRKSKFNTLNLKLVYKILGRISEKDFKKYLSKEFIINNDIFQIPAPNIEIKKIEESKLEIKLSIWCQTQNASKVQDDIFKIITKLANKHKITFETENLNSNNCS